MEGPGGDGSGRKETAADGGGAVDAAVAAEEEAEAGRRKEVREATVEVVGGAADGGWMEDAAVMGDGWDPMGDVAWIERWWECTPSGTTTSRLGPVGEQESPRDSWPIRQDFREIGGSCGSSGTFTESHRNQHTVEDRRGLTKRFALNGFNH